MACASQPTVFVASAARTTSSNSGGQAISEFSKVAILVDVTVVSGTDPSMALSVEWSHNGTDYAASDTADTFTAIIAAKKTAKLFDAKGPFYRLVWAITGTLTPSFTFSASQYALEA